MPNPLTTLRNEVLKDIRDGSDLSNGQLPQSAQVIEGGGSREHTFPSDSISSNPVNVYRALISGTDHLDPTATPDVTFQSAGDRLSQIDDYLRYVVRQAISGLQVVPFIAFATNNTQVKVLPTGTHPVVYNEHFYTYAGGSIDLLSYVPAIPIPDLGVAATTNVLLVLNTTTNGIEVITNGTIVADPTQWPIDRIPLAVVLLTSDLRKFGNQFIGYDSITDARPFISWGQEVRYFEQLWFAQTAPGTSQYFYPAGMVLRTPTNQWVKVFRNGQELTEGSSYDYTIGFDTPSNRYYVQLTFTIDTAERLKSWYAAF